MSVIYLAGPINGCTDPEARDWRTDIAKRLPEHTILSPMVRDYHGHEYLSADEIVSGDKADIDSCDILIAYCPKPSVGTSMEVLYAWERRHHVIVWAPSGHPTMSPWLRYHAHTICVSLDSTTAAARMAASRLVCP